jgi:hypothetical protein
MSSADALAGREDVSRFVIHLTRNDKQDFSNGGSARKNFLKSLVERHIRAYSPHCLWGSVGYRRARKPRRRPCHVLPSSRAEAVAGPRQSFALAEFLPQRCFLLRPHVRSEGSARRPQGWRFV